MKKVFIWVGVGVGVFIALVGILFAVLSYMEPADEEMQVAGAENNSPASSQLTTNKKIPFDSLTTQINKLKSELFFNKLVNDSLAEQLTYKDVLIDEYKKTISRLNDEVLAVSKQKVNIKELAKTYETMKTDEMRPILKNVDGETVIAIYRHMNSRTRKNILKALAVDRAAAITEQLAGVKKKVESLSAQSIANESN